MIMIMRIWWKYAALLPVEWYDKIIHQVDLNKASYNMIKNLAISQRDIFINNLGLETLYVPSEWRLNEILAGDDLNDFVKPKVYRCVDGETKLKVKNTPPDFSQKAGFRLVVKYIAANAGDNTAVLQILEPNVSSAAVYRRYGHRHGNDWGYWYRVATTDYVDEKVKDQLNHVILKIKNEIIEDVKKSLLLSLPERNFSTNSIDKNCEDLQKKNKLLEHDLEDAKAMLDAEKRKVGEMNNNLNKIHNSASYKIGRFITFIPMGVDREYYKSVVEKFEAGITDERIANYSYASMAKFVRTAKYNYRMSIAQKGYFRIENRIRNDEPVHTFYWIDAKIIHYGGALTNIKPWFLNFNEGEIKHANQEYFLLLPEISKLFPLWWKYAAYLPANTYNELLLNEKINKAAYNMIKSVTIWQREIFLNTLGVETLNIQSYWGENNIEPNFYLNDYVKPKLYRCIDGKTKVTGKNLPKDFYQISGFRLVVKSIAAYAGEKTSILQIIEPNDGCASVYRRCGTKQGKNWSKWYKVATTDDVCNVADEKVKELSCYLDKRFDNLVDDFESERESTQKAIDDLRKIVNKLQEEQAKLSSENHNLVVANKNLEAKNRRLENNLTTAQSDLVSIQNSVSYKFGRTMTYIPRKIRDAFKTKK